MFFLGHPFFKDPLSLFFFFLKALLDLTGAATETLHLEESGFFSGEKWRFHRWKWGIYGDFTWFSQGKYDENGDVTWFN